MGTALCGAAGAQTAPVPPEFQTLYPLMQSDLDTFQQTLDGLWNKQVTPIGFAADLLTANSNRGTGLLGSSTQMTVQAELTAMQKMGITTAAVTIHFPIVYAPYFLSSQGGLATGNTAAQYISFYQWVVTTAHSMNPPMRVAVESYVNWTSGIIPGLPNLATYYQSLGLNGYMAARAAMEVTIAQQIQPDFLSIQAEPDTEALQSGYSDFNTPSTDLQLVNGIISALETASPPITGLHTSMKISAGIGTWNWTPFQSLIQAEATLPGLDELTMHILPINATANNNDLSNALQLIQLAQQNHKSVAVPQAWLNKMWDSEITQGPGTATIFGRNVYSFWAPLDQEFLQILTKLGYYGSLDFVTPFWGDWFFYIYLDYSSIPGCPYNASASPPSAGYPDASCGGAKLQSLESNAAASLIQAGAGLTGVGITYQQLIAGHFLPEVTSGPAISPFPIVGQAAQLSVTGNDGAGGSNVSYLWTVTGTPPANPQIATPAAATTNVTFSAAGSYSFQVTVTGADGLAVIRGVQCTVSPSGPGSPVITSSLTAQGSIGVPFSYQTMSNPAATSFGAAGLPLGLAINTTSGLISGAAVVSGIFSVTLSASNSTGMGTAKLALTIVQAPGGVIYRIDSGRSTSYTDPAGNVWSVDEGFTGGSSVSTTNAISGTTTPVLYQTARQSTPTYTLPVQNGDYTVILKFAEIQYLAAGKRQFNVAIDGIQVLTNFDIVATAGAAFKAVDKCFPASTSSGSITIQLSNGAAGTGLINGIEILTAGVSATPVITSPLTVQGTQGAAFNYQIAASPAATSFDAMGLPAGLTINASSGLISGTPQVYGVFPIALSATNADGTGTANLSLTINQAPPGTAIYLIDSGSSNSYTDPAGNVWSADEDFTGISTVSTTNAISGTTAPVAYQTARQSTPTYTLPVQNGDYTVVLKFAEIQYSSSGKRQFNVAINGTQVLSNFDIVAAAGAANAAVDECFPVTVSSGFITIQLSNGTAGTGLINGIEILTASVAATPVISSPLTAQGTQGTAFNYQITASPAATSFNALGLPAGLTFNANSGLISGTPQAYGVFPIALSASNLDGTGTANLSLTINQAPPGTAIYLIDSGSSTSYTDPAGNAWSADEDFTGGSSVSTTNAINGTTTPAVYQTALQGTPTYTLPVQNGAYTVVLKFAEIQYLAAGQRQFNVAINGTQVLSNFDIVAAAGAANAAVDECFPVTVSSGFITIQVSNGTAGTGLINGIEILTACVAATPVIISPLTAQGALATAFNYQITASPAAASFGAVGLPAGLTVNANSGLISGTPQVYGSFSATLSASNPGGTGLATLSLTINQTLPGTPMYLIDSGSSTSYTDPGGNVWNADTDFTGGSTTSTTKAISATTTPVVYQTARQGLPTYTFAVPNGDYTVILKFAEIQYSAAGKRNFNVTINGTRVLNNFDIAAAAGAANTAVDEPFPVMVAGGAITIQFSAGTAGTGLINGIEILTASIAGTPVIGSPLTAQGTQGAAFNYQIVASPAATNFNALGLPAGLAFNASSGLISGSPRVYGSFSVALSASNQDGTGTASLSLTINQAPPGTAIYLIDSGRSTSYTDPAGNVWSADEDFTGGSSVSTTNAINGTTTPVVYQTARQSTPTYTLPVQNGDYTVVLKFAEIQYSSAGKRQFNVAVDGIQVLTNFDIVATAGTAFAALDKSFPVTVSGGSITIQLSNGTAGTGLINGIEILTAP